MCCLYYLRVECAISRSRSAARAISPGYEPFVLSQGGMRYLVKRAVLLWGGMCYLAKRFVSSEGGMCYFAKSFVLS